MPTWILYVLLFITYTSVIHYYELQKGYGGDTMKERLRSAITDNANLERLKTTEYTVNPRYDKKMRNGVKWFMSRFGFDVEVKFDLDMKGYKIVVDEKYEGKNTYKISRALSKFLTGMLMLLLPVVHFNGNQKEVEAV